MREKEILLARLGLLLNLLARPHSCDAIVPVEIQANLWQLGVACEPCTPREELVAQLWARKRSLQMALFPLWGGPGATPPAAA